MVNRDTNANAPIVLKHIKPSSMRKLQDRKLLRHLKQEGHNSINWDNEILTRNLVPDHTIPLREWSYEELKTRLEEIMYQNYKLYTLFPDYYKQECYGADGEYWDIYDEMENIAQMYGIDIYGE